MNRCFSSILVLMILLLAACSHEEDQDVVAGEEEQEVNITPDLRVMTYNIHMANPPSLANDVRDLPAIAKVIKESGADLVALQEVDKLIL